MALNLTRVHDYQKIPDTNEMRLVAEHHYVRLCADQGPPVYIQGGVVYAEGGAEVHERPAWFEAELAKVSPAMLKRVGWVGTTPAAAPIPPPAVVPLRLWTCPQCQAVMSTKKKGLHVSRHRREAKPAAVTE